MHGFITTPVEDAGLKRGEACFNVSKARIEYEALLQHKIITPTGRTFQVGSYPQPHPICRINLPLYREEEPEEQSTSAFAQLLKDAEIITL